MALEGLWEYRSQAQCKSSLRNNKMSSNSKSKRIKARKQGQTCNNFMFFFSSFSVQLCCSLSLSSLLRSLCSQSSESLALFQSIWPPDGLLQTTRSAHGCRGVAVTAVGFHALVLGVQARIHQAVGPSSACGPWARQEAGGGALTPGVPWRHHRELVRSGARAVIQVRVGLEVLRLVVCVGGRQVGVVSRGGRHAQAADASAGGVGRVREGPRVMHAGVWEARVCQRGQRREGGPLLEDVCSPWPWSQILLHLTGLQSRGIHLLRPQSLCGTEVRLNWPWIVVHRA